MKLGAGEKRIQTEIWLVWSSQRERLAVVTFMLKLLDRKSESKIFAGKRNSPMATTFSGQTRPSNLITFRGSIVFVACIGEVQVAVVLNRCCVEIMKT